MPDIADGRGADADLASELTPHLIHSAIVIFSLVIAWLAASAFFGQWDTWLRFRFQNRSSCASRSPGALPAIMAPLIAPMEMPHTQSGSNRCSVSA